MQKICSVFLAVATGSKLPVFPKNRSVHPSASQLWNMLAWQRDVLGMAGDPDQMINYGCYCQLYNGPVTGRGEPVDEFDAYVFTHIGHKFQINISLLSFDTIFRKFK